MKAWESRPSTMEGFSNVLKGRSRIPRRQGGWALGYTSPVRFWKRTGVQSMLKARSEKGPHSSSRFQLSTLESKALQAVTSRMFRHRHKDFRLASVSHASLIGGHIDGSLQQRIAE